MFLSLSRSACTAAYDRTGVSLGNGTIGRVLTIHRKNIKFSQLLLQFVEKSLYLRTSIDRLMTIETDEVNGNGREKNLIECPHCGQKLFSVSFLDGVAEVVVKCRRCHKFIRVKMVP